MDAVVRYIFAISLLGSLTTEGFNVKLGLPVPWQDEDDCKVNDQYFQEDNSSITLCDPDGTLPPIHRMITSDVLHYCKEYSADNTTFILFLADTGIYYGGKNKSYTAEDLALDYNLVNEESESVIFLVVAKNPFKVDEWHSESLSSTLNSNNDLDLFKDNFTETYREDKNFPVVVNQLVHFFCEKVRAPPYQLAEWDWLTILWMILVIVLIAAVTATVIHLIMVRYKAFHRGNISGHPRGRASLGPLSMEMEDFGITPFQPSRNMLLSTTDVTAVPQQQQASTSSTANLLDS